MLTTKEDIGNWFDEGVAAGATHMFIVCDTFINNHYPVYILPHEDPREIAGRYIPVKNLQRIEECYSLSMDKEEQLDEDETNNWD